MNQESTMNLPPFEQGIFTLPPYDESPPKLMGGFCPDCNTYYFPRPRFCRVCLGQVEERVFGSKGTVYSFTVVRTKPPQGLPQPYSVGYIDLADNNLRVFCLLDPAAIDRIQIGMPVRLRIGPLGVNGDGEPCLRPYYTPATES